jgi:5,10-methylenetetrahydrofolate reductase
LEDDRDAGVEHALNMVEQLRRTNVVEGVHLVPVTRVVQVAERLRLGR